MNIAMLLSALCAYAVSRFVFMPHLPACLWRSHGHDFLAVLVLLSAANLYIVALKRPDLQIVRLPHTLALALAAGLFWEFVTPLYRHSTPDPADLVAYLLGALCYHFAVCPAAFHRQRPTINQHIV